MQVNALPEEDYDALAEASEAAEIAEDRRQKRRAAMVQARKDAENKAISASTSPKDKKPSSAISDAARASIEEAGKTEAAQPTEEAAKP